MQGRRLPDTTWPTTLPCPESEFRDGDYWFCHGHPTQPRYHSPGWFIYYQGARHIPLHFVYEHEDGTISVPAEPNGDSQNSILCGGKGGDEVWHGWIRHGVWEEL